MCGAALYHWVLALRVRITWLIVYSVLSILDGNYVSKQV